MFSLHFNSPFQDFRFFQRESEKFFDFATFDFQLETFESKLSSFRSRILLPSNINDDLL